MSFDQMTVIAVSKNTTPNDQNKESSSMFSNLQGQTLLAGIITLGFISGMLLTKHTTLPQQVFLGASDSVSSAFESVANVVGKSATFAANNINSFYQSYTNTAEQLIERPTPHKPVKLDVQVAEAPAASVPFISSAHAQEAELNSTDYFEGSQGSPFESFADRFNHRNKEPVVASLQEINNFLRYRHSEYSFVENKYFLQNAKTKLPKYERLFRQAAKHYNLDWRLVAAIAYQESVWNPNAVSPTGVEGMMMLTRTTAKEMGVQDRTNSAESIYGGTGYFTKLLKRLPADITGPDRVLMALASYNMGYGHLKAARHITAQQGADSTKWAEVKKRLPLLQKKQYYQYSRYGYARNALQAIHYVGEIQKHYDMLLMLTEQQRIKAGNLTKATQAAFALARYDS